MAQKLLNIPEKMKEFICLQVMCSGVFFFVFFFCWLGCAVISLDMNPASWEEKAQINMMLLPVFAYAFCSLHFFLDYFID